MEDNKWILQRLLEEDNWSDEDCKWFLDYLNNNDSSVLQKLMQNQFTENITNELNSKDASARKVLELIHGRIKSNTKSAKVIRISMWKKMTAAVVIIFLLGAGTYFLFSGKEKNEIAKTENKKNPDNFMPGGNKAILTLANGSIVTLNNLKNGTITQQGNTKISKLTNGRLDYSLVNEKSTIVLYNTITTPRGGQYQLTLSDGTKVWLNALSSLHYPTNFTGKERKVELTGEAYFEVAHNAEMPFHVNVKGVDVKVLGTHFNVNAYNDETALKVTLLEGSVQVKCKTSIAKIKPGQQAEIAGTTNSFISVKEVNVSDAVAWKNGFFSFRHSGVREIITQLSRWYDIHLSYSGDMENQEFTGKIDRSLNLSQVLKILEKTGVYFKIENGSKPTTIS